MWKSLFIYYTLFIYSFGSTQSCGLRQQRPLLKMLTLLRYHIVCFYTLFIHSFGPTLRHLSKFLFSDQSLVCWRMQTGLFFKPTNQFCSALWPRHRWMVSGSGFSLKNKFSKHGTIGQHSNSHWRLHGRSKGRQTCRPSRKWYSLAIPLRPRWMETTPNCSLLDLSGMEPNCFLSPKTVSSIMQAQFLWLKYKKNTRFTFLLHHCLNLMSFLWH